MPRLNLLFPFVQYITRNDFVQLSTFHTVHCPLIFQHRQTIFWKYLSVWRTINEKHTRKVIMPIFLAGALWITQREAKYYFDIHYWLNNRPCVSEDQIGKLLPQSDPHSMACASERDSSGLGSPCPNSMQSSAAIEGLSSISFQRPLTVHETPKLLAAVTFHPSWTID